MGCCSLSSLALRDESLQSLDKVVDSVKTGCTEKCTQQKQQCLGLIVWSVTRAAMPTAVRPIARATPTPLARTTVVAMF